MLYRKGPAHRTYFINAKELNWLPKKEGVCSMPVLFHCLQLLQELAFESEEGKPTFYCNSFRKGLNQCLDI